MYYVSEARRNLVFVTLDKIDAVIQAQRKLVGLMNATEALAESMNLQLEVESTTENINKTIKKLTNDFTKIRDNLKHNTDQLEVRSIISKTLSKSFTHMEKMYGKRDMLPFPYVAERVMDSDADTIESARRFKMVPDRVRATRRKWRLASWM